MGQPKVLDYLKDHDGSSQKEIARACHIEPGSLTSILFGYFIDFTMILLAFVNPQSYVVKIIDLLIGCLILGFGVYIEVLANVVMLPGESFVRAITQTWNLEFGTIKVMFDVSMAVIAIVMSLMLSHRVNGVREGTIIAALLVGAIARQFGKRLSFLNEKLFPQTRTAESEAEETTGASCVIAIGRQYGCRGSEFGRKLAAQGNCVIVGRCVDQVLKDNPNCLRVFFHASLSSRVHCIMERKSLNEKEARADILREDKRRGTNYRYYTGKNWGTAENYQLCLDTDLGYDYVQECVKSALAAMRSADQI